VTSSPSDALIDALGDAQGIGLLGDRPIPEVIAHAGAFVTALAPVTGRIIDLGSGGGVPGLVIADARADLEIVLLDRREKRTDFLERVVRRLGWSDRVQVVHGDAAVLGRRAPHRARYDAAVSRGFGPPDVTVRLSTPFVCAGGWVILTDPPAGHGDRWTAIPHPGLHRTSPPGSPVVVFRVVDGLSQGPDQG
jgi:16S rRNA (guanine527-N7)-methyltransferase